jgi:hypothetical protein
VAREAGTVVIPGHGRLYDQYDVIEYRDMVTIVRDRVQESRRGGTVAGRGQGRQARKGYVAAIGNAVGGWTADRFVEAVYRSSA